jgi:ubiquinone/menaquinone biosynthesis C-methylase UbiE
MGYKVAAIDIDRQVAKLVSKKANDMCSRISIISMDTFNLGFEDNSFDTAFHEEVLEHFDDETIIEALKEQRRVARVVIFDVPHDKYGLDCHNVGNERLLSIRY